MTRPRGCRAGRPPESPSPAPGEPSDDTTVAAAGRPAAFASLRDSRRPVARHGVAAFLLCSVALLAPTWAHAQTAWVSNTGQARGSSWINVGNTDKVHAQGFTTGTVSGGYSLGNETSGCHIGTGW